MSKPRRSPSSDRPPPHRHPRASSTHPDWRCGAGFRPNIGSSISGRVEILCLAAQALDRAESLSAAILEEGQTIRNRAGVRAHPLLRDEVANRALIARLLSKLGINVEPVKPVGRPTSPLAGHRRHDDQSRSDRPQFFGADHAARAGHGRTIEQARELWAQAAQSATCCGGCFRPLSPTELGDDGDASERGAGQTGCASPSA